MTGRPDSYGAGVRLPFAELPAPVVDWIAGQLGAPIVRVRDRTGGFSPGVAASVQAADGSGIFVKAVSGSINADSLRIYRNERDRAALLPDLPGVLRPTGSAEIDVAGSRWIMIIFPLLSGEPPQHPWNCSDAVRTLDLLQQLGAAGTPSPLPADPERTAEMIDFFTGWTRLADSAAADADPWLDDRWIVDRLDLLRGLDAEVGAALPGDTLTHFDLRADNLMITADQLWVVDWAHARNAARWVDPVLLIGDLVASRADRADGGEIDVPRLLREHPAVAGVPARLQYAALAGLAATLHGFSRQPAAPGLPTIRGWQARTAETLLGFVRRQPESALA